MTRRRPEVTLKLATSLDSRIALANGISKWITGPESRARVHELRAAHDTVLTGIGTVLADDPRMSARKDGVDRPSQPRRAVMDTHLRLPSTSQMLAAGPVTVFHSTASQPEPPEGTELVQLPTDSSGRASISAALEWLYETGSRTVMIEAGGKLAASAIASDLVDKIEWFRAPILLGGDGLPAIAALGLENLEAPPTFQRTHTRECGRDTWETWERR